MTEDDFVKEFEVERDQRILNARVDKNFQSVSQAWLREAFKKKYMYNFHVMGRPIIQLPNDIVAMNELVWSVKPDLIIETGIAHGGSLILSASLLAVLDLCDATTKHEMLNPAKPKRKVIGVDIDIRSHNRAAIEAHPMSNRITMIEGSSIDIEIVNLVKAAAGDAQTVLVCLDSNHTHDHVLAELYHYAPMVSVGSYCIVFDTVVENLPTETFPDRPWGPSNSPMTAVETYMSGTTDFWVDEDMDAKLQISAAPRGYLKRVR